MGFVPEPVVVVTRCLSCCVPGCPRHRGLRKGETVLPAEWLCYDHWMLVPARYRRLHGRLKRRAKNRPDSAMIVNSSANHWERCKRLAIEGAMGIG
jgi:hypothetical protein